MLMVLGGIFWLAAVVCSLFILVDAFKDEVWKGIVGFFCGLYLIYYGIVEFQHPNKPIILGVWLLGGILGSVLFQMGGGNNLAR